MEASFRSPEWTRIAEALPRFGVTEREIAAMLQRAAGPRQDAAAVIALKQRLRENGVAVESDALERVLLSYAISESLPRIGGLPVHEPVKPLIRREFDRLSQPATGKNQILAGTDEFIAACRIATLRRFPSGPMDWVVSGMPRSWFAKIPPRNLPAALRFITVEFGGIRPAFYMHVAHPPRNRSLILEKEVRRSYYRMARSLMLQPAMKGIMCASWFHDPAALEAYPHLAAMNEPYLKLGGRIVASLGPAPVESGFLKFNPERRGRVERGELVLHTTLAMWPRKAAIAWAEQHPELDGA